MSKTLHAVVTKEQFLHSYLKELPDGGLFLHTEDVFGPGDDLILKLQMIGLKEEMEFQGVIAWHRRPRAWSSSLPAGVGFQFTPRDTAKRDFLLQFAQGEVSDRRRAGPRHNIEYEARIRIHDTWVAARIRNPGAGGMMLMTEEKIDTGITLPCVVYLEGFDAPSECSVQVERVEKDRGIFIAGVRFLRLPQGLREAFEEMPISAFVFEMVPETRAQQILRRSTFPPETKITGTFSMPVLKK
jgi:Tfp pilus assembly protein PilZ